MTAAAVAPAEGRVEDPEQGGLVAIGLGKSFDDVQAVRSVDLTVLPGQVHGLLGPNGAGKSTLLSMVLGLCTPDSGTVSVLGSPLPARRGGLPYGVAGFVEAPAFAPHLSAQRTLEHLLALDDGPGGPAGRAEVDRVLAVVGLSGSASAKVRGLSVGMRQRLGIAAALLRRPRLLVLDEPWSGLDPAGVQTMHAVIRQLVDDGAAVLLSSHNMAEVDAVCSHVTVLRSGEVAFSGPLSTLRAQAPPPVHLLRTNDDARTVTMASRLGLSLTRDTDGLVVHAGQAELDELVVTLGKMELAVRSLTLRHSALQAAFLALTGPAGEMPGRGERE